jgi:hypothetical protein
LIVRKIRGLGFEPRTNWLKANCSTTELPPLFLRRNEPLFKAEIGRAQVIFRF